MTDESWQTNRSRKREPKFGKFWCENCDRDYVESGKKCKHCGVRDSDRRRDNPGAR